MVWVLKCANKHWNRQDQIEAYNARAAQSNPDMDWIRQKNLFAEREREQEAKAFMSDPDLFSNWGGHFKSGR